VTGKSKFKSFCALVICLAFLASFTVFISSPPVSAGAPRAVGNPVPKGGANPIASGWYQSFALKGDGTAWAWGYNTVGQLGDGTTTTRLTPVKVLGMDNAVAVVSGWGHSLALRGDGTVWAWGWNSSGQLGDNTTTERHAPVRVQGLENVVAVACGLDHSLAVRGDGTVWAWGANEYGQLGDNTTDNRHTPVRVLGIENAVAIDGGNFHSFALRGDGTVWAWGRNIFGCLGDGTSTERHTPVKVDGMENAVAISVGTYHSLALKAEGTVWAWGNNMFGQLGDNTIADRWAPVRVLGMENVVAVAGGGDHSLALKGDGTVWAWGWNSNGQLGDNTTENRYTPVRVLGMENAVAIAGGSEHSLALKGDGTVWAWGFNTVGQLGDGTTTNRWTPVKVSDLHRTSPAQVNTSAASTIMDSSATLNGELTSLGNPDLIAVAGGKYYSLALGEDGTVLAWGGNGEGQLGDNTTTDRHTPVRVLGLENVAAIAGGRYHSLALRGDGIVWAWGLNLDGQLGDGTTTEKHTPVRVLGLENVVAIAGGGNHSLALRGDGTVWAWGYNNNGQLGDNTDTNRWTPVRVLGLENAVAIAGGGNHSLALRGDGTVWAWGRNHTGQLGDNTTTERYTPVRVLGLENVAAVAGGWNHSLALRADGTVWAWGWNNSGQLGDNTTTDRQTPVKTSDLPLSFWFEWGETTGYGNSTTEQEKTGVGSFSAGLSGLDPWTIYHFRAVVQNSVGISYGGGENFKTTDSISPDAPLNLSAFPSGWTNSNSFTVSWINPPENSEVVGAYYKLDSAPTADNDGTLESGAGITSISGISVSGEGVYIIYVWLKDNAGNADHNNRNSISLKLDASSPANPQVTSSTHPEGVSTRDPNPSFSWTSVGGPSPVTFYYKLEGYDDGWQSTSGTGKSYTGLRDGPYTFEVYAVDVGGTGEIDSYTFKVDTSAPSVQLSGTVKGRATATVGGWQLTTSDFTLTLSMTVSDISDVTVYVNGQSVPVVGGSFSKALTLAGGTNNFTIMVVDSAGNSTTRTLAVTQTVPAPPVAPPAGPASEMVLFVIVVIVLIISGAAVIFVFVKPPEK